MSLAVTYDEIRRAIGLLLGIGRTPDAWEPNEQEDVDGIIRAGVRNFYYYAPAEGQQRHVWSFLRPVATLDLTAGVATYELPADFGEILDGDASLSAGGRLARVSEEHLRALPARSGTPLYYALRIKAIAAGGPSRWEVLVYPTPDDSAVAASPSLSLRYAVVPPDLGPDNQHPLGGAMHGECVREACLAEAERTLHDEEGLHGRRFATYLATSIAIDRQLQTPADDGVWPLENPPDGLLVNKAYLKRLIGRQLAFGPHPGVWTHKQAQEVNLALETGLRKFYSPVVLPGERYGHEWSYLCPTITITTTAAQERYDLPDDVAILVGPLTHAPTAVALYPPIDLVGEHQVRMRQQQSTAQGRPCIAATRVRALDPSGVTRQELLLWPTPDGEYTLRGRSQVNPSMIPEDVALPFGGQPHAQTVIEACLAAAEEQVGTGKGLHAQRFLERLIASVAHDRKVASPASLGFNRDSSDRPGDAHSHHEYSETIHAYNGVEY